MNQMKQKLHFSESSTVRIKKSRGELFINGFYQSITSIENLSNEIFYDIFDYLYGHEIYQAFSYLNHHFQQLLNSSSLRYKTILYSSQYEIVNKMNYNQFLHMNKNQILTMRIGSQFTAHDQFFSSISSLNHLESLSLRNIQSNTLITLLHHLVYLPRFSSLEIDSWERFENLNNIYSLIFALPTLKNIKLDLNGQNISTSLPLYTIDKQSSPLEHLDIEYSCTLEQLSSIITYTPNLRRLNFARSDKDVTSMKNMFPMTLTYIKLHIDFKTFEKFENFIQKCPANLKVFTAFIITRDITFLNADRWEQLILQYCPQLEKFSFEYMEDSGDDRTFAHSQRPFSSSFWIDRQWIFEAEIAGEYIIYSIRSYRKRWYEYTHDNISNSSFELSKATRVILTYGSTDEYDIVIKEDSKRVLTIGQIYHLEVSERNIFSGLLIQAIAALPELRTLKIHSLSLYEPKNLSSDELMILSSTKQTSKITKVCLEVMNEISEIYFLMALCPFMEYLKLEYFNNIQVFIRKILKRIKIEKNEYLRLLCFSIPAADDETIEEIRKIIDVEKLLVNYTIQRVEDDIYLQWK